MTSVRPTLWIIDPDDGSNARRDRIEQAAGNVFVVKAAGHCSDLDATIVGEAAGIIGHSRDLHCDYLRQLPLKIVHYAGGNISPPKGFALDREFRVRYAIDRGTNSRVPSGGDFIALRDWLLGSGPRPAWIIPFKVAAGAGLQALDILVVGLLATLDQGALANSVLLDSGKNAPRDAQLPTLKKAGEPRRIEEWFKPAMEVIDRAITEDEACWAEVCGESKDPNVQRNVESLRQTYLHLKEAPETTELWELSQWSEQLRAAHRAFQELWKGGYL